VYTYTAQGLRVAQSVDGDVTTFAWDWASGVPELLNEGDNLYLVGHDTLGAWDGAAWTYYLPDALGSVRQEVDGAGSVVSAREWTPYGVEVGAGQAGLGYTGEWNDPNVGLTYLRARWYDGQVGRFTQVDSSRLEHSPYLYADANPVTFTDPTGMCKHREGDPPDTCRVEHGDPNLYRIALAAHPHIDPWEQIEAWNPERWYPAYQNYYIHVGDLIYLRGRDATPSVQGGSPLDTISGYLEGKMKSSTLSCITWWVEGEEIVYDFARIPPERARFTYRGVGISYSALDVTVTDYAGFIWGFDPKKPERGIFEDYEGASISASVGATVNLPPGFRGAFSSLGSGFGGFKALIGQVFGFTAYTSEELSADTPGVGLTFSFLGTYYTRDENSWLAYGDTAHPAAGMYSAISTGNGSPAQNNPIIGATRSSTANQVYRVLGRYYTERGFAAPSR